MAKAVSKKKEEQLPEIQTIESSRLALIGFSSDSKNSYLIKAFSTLTLNPPQTLLIEGGSTKSRLLAASYWGLLLNCPSRSLDASGIKTPCLSCPTCTKLLSFLHRDLFFFDGTKGSIKIDDIREMLAVLGEAPREAHKRIVIFHEAQALGDPSANSLLKSLEDPIPDTNFVLTVPQRARLLPTIVSRSWVLTLPWASALSAAIDDTPKNQEEIESLTVLNGWEEVIVNFAITGQGWMDKSSKRGAIDATIAMNILLRCQNALLLALNYQNSSADFKLSLLADKFTKLSLNNLKILNEVLNECQESLIYTVNPTLVLDWMVTRIYFLFSMDRIR